jgi:hypothetical protein
LVNWWKGKLKEMKPIVYKANGDEYETTPANSEYFVKPELDGIVGGEHDVLELDNERSMVVRAIEEHGLNVKATELFDHEIFGDVLVTPKYYLT